MAGVSAATLVKRFGSKEDLFLRLSQRWVASLDDDLAARAATLSSPVARLRAVALHNYHDLDDPATAATQLAALAVDLQHDEMRNLLHLGWGHVRTHRERHAGDAVAAGEMSGGPAAGQLARIVLAAGATRGAGRAIAVELARAGAFVYATGRSSRTTGRSEIDRPETIEDTGDLVRAVGAGEALRVDTHLITSRYAIPLLLASGGGLVVEMTDGTSSFSAAYRQGVGFYYDLVKANVELIVTGLTSELAEHPVTTVGVTPGWLRSENMLENVGVTEPPGATPWTGYPGSRSPSPPPTSGAASPPSPPTSTPPGSPAGSSPPGSSPRPTT